MNQPEQDKKEESAMEIIKNYKGYYKKQIEKLNAQAYEFYLTKQKHLSEFYIKKAIWSSQIWRNAKSILREFNQSKNNGELICEACNKPIKPYVRFFQLHHKNLDYNWEKLFAPSEIELIHKTCHHKIHNDLNYNKNKSKKGEENG